MEPETSTTAETEEHRVARLEQAVAQLERERQAAREAQHHAGSWAGKPLTAFQREMIEHQNRGLARRREEAARREAERQARAEANAPLVAKLVPERERLRADRDEARVMLQKVEQELHRREQALHAISQRIANLEFGAEGAT